MVVDMRAGSRDVVGSSSDRPSSDRFAVIALVALAFAGVALRFLTLHVQSFDEDEAITVGLLHRSLGGMLNQIPISEQTPPVYYVLAWGWARLFGFGEVGLRSLSAVAGAVTVVLAYLAGREWRGRPVGVAAAVLVACNPFLFWYAQEARSYALLVVLCAAGLWMFIRALGGDAKRDLWLWSLFSALALATHYFAFFLVAPEAAWLLARAEPEQRRSRVMALVPVAVTGLALIPLLIAQRSPTKYPFTALESLATRTGQIPRQFLLGFTLPAAALWGAAALILLGSAAWSLVRTRRDDAFWAIVITVGFALVAPVAIALTGLDEVLARNFVAVLVPCLLLAGAGFGARRYGLAAGAVLSVVWLGAIAVVQAEPQYQRPPWRTVAGLLSGDHRPRLILVAPSPLGVAPVQVYLPDIRAFRPNLPVKVTELDIVGMLPQGSAGRNQILRVRAPSTRFHVVSREQTSAFVLVRFVTSRPYLISPRFPLLLRTGTSDAALARSLCCDAVTQHAS
jgi:mannosyltransferase